MENPHNTYWWSMSGNKVPPGPERLRIEDPGKPDLGQLVAVGSIVRTNYNTGPYRVSRVHKYEPYPGVACWSVIGQEVVEGVVIKGSGDRILNEYVVEWDGDTPRFLGLFSNNNDEFFLEQGVAYIATRTGQLSLF